MALDLPSATACSRFLDALATDLPTGYAVRWVKVGLELFLAEGPAIVSWLRERGQNVFLDLKLHDIPNTVAGAVRSVLAREPSLLTVHAAGGPAMLSAAAEAAAGSATRLLAVTVLTSLDDAQLHAIGVDSPAAGQVERLARLAHANGVAGLVCSPREVGRLRSLLPDAFLVTPGIRPAGSAHGDQQRAATPAEAIGAGSHQIVVGRPIIAAPHPAAAFAAILDEIAAAL